MKDKKGFTLSEILVVIVIIGLILLIAIPSMFGISKSIKKRELESKKDVLVSAAEVYAKNNASKFASIGDFLVIQVPVKTLVYYGYITPDSNETVCGEDQTIGCIVNPVNNASMNEEIITIRKNKSIIQASWGTGDTPEPVSSQSGQKEFSVSLALNGAEFWAYHENQSTATSCSTTQTSCTIDMPTIVRTGFDIIGFNTTMTSKTATANSESKLILNSSNDGKTYYAITKKNVTVTFNANGGTFASNSVTSSSCEYYNKAVSCVINNDPNATRTAYEYGTPKWKDSVGTAIDLSAVSSSVTAYLNWSPISYTVTLNPNGGTYASTPSGYTVSGSNYTKNYNITTATFTLPNPKRTDYKFLGWTGSNGTTAQTSVSVTKGSSGNKTYTAQWEACATGYTSNADSTACVPRTYTVTLNPNGGAYSSTPSGYTQSGNNCTKNYNITTETFTLPHPGKDGHIFSGWTGSNGTAAKKPVSVTKGSSGDKSYTANYSACLAGTYALAGDESCTPCAAGTYQDQTGQTSCIDCSAGTYQSQTGQTTCPVCADGYYTDQTAQTACTPCDDGYTSNSTHTGCTPRTYTVTFNVNGGTAWTSTTCPTSSYTFNSSSKTCSKGVQYQGEYGNMPTPKRTDYIFLGWYTDSSGGTKVVTTSHLVWPGDKTLYAHWGTAPHYLTLMGNSDNSAVTFPSTTGWTISNNNNKSASAKKEFYGGESYGTLPTPTRADSANYSYEFLGWYTAASGGSAVSSTDVMPNSAQTLYAHWKSNQIYCVLSQSDSSCSGTGYNTGGCTVKLTCPSGHSCGLSTGTHSGRKASVSTSCSGEVKGKNETYTRSVTIYKAKYFILKGTVCNSGMNVTPGRYWNFTGSCNDTAGLNSIDDDYCSNRQGVKTYHTSCSVEIRYSFDTHNSYWIKA